MKKYDHILFCGDSWTVATHTDGIFPRPFTVDETFPYIVSKHLGAKYTKIAMGGAGNDWIHRNVFEHLPKLVKKNKKMLCVVGWSDPQRVELFCNATNTLENVGTPPFSEDFFKYYIVESFNHDHASYIEHTANLIQSTHYLYEYYCVDYVDAFAFTKPICVDVPKKANVLPKTFTDIVGLGEGRLYNKETKTWWHQTPIGNQMIADELIKFVEKTYG